MAIRKRRYAPRAGVKLRTEALTLDECALDTLSLKNIAAVLAACPGASYVAGYREWRKLGRYVPRGSKAIYILAPCGRDDDDKPRFKAVPVFDISQTCELGAAGEVPAVAA